jgi:predicted Rossmann-fold nucleotide-binding protein
MEELFEVWAWRYIGYHSKPVGLVNAGGFYDDLLRMLARMRDEGFMKKAMLDDLCVSDTTEGILDALEAKAAEKSPPILKTPERRK